jgi:uncharacterized membrane protein YagU involved in acid resistance
MDRSWALILSLVFFLLFALLAYYGAKVTLWSSIVFALFISLILLNFFYPISQVADDDADLSLVLYATFFIIGLIILTIYIVQSTLSTVRNDYDDCSRTCSITCLDDCQYTVQACQ